MEKNSSIGLKGAIMWAALLVPVFIHGQKTDKFNEAATIGNYLKKLPQTDEKATCGIEKYRMTAVYTNRDLYGNFMDKLKISGEYTCGLENGLVTWNNIFIAGSNSIKEPFPDGTRQDYMEGFKYVPSPKMLEATAFSNFPSNPQSVFAKNLVWDMMAIEGFARDYSDSLKLNKVYRISELNGEFQMADIGTYNHTEIQICWTGISEVDNQLCSVIEYRAIDNIIGLSMEGFKTRGTEQYWGTVQTSLKTGSIESALMYGGTIQEIEIAGMTDKFLVKTIRELWLDKIR